MNELHTDVATLDGQMVWDAVFAMYERKLKGS